MKLNIAKYKAFFFDFDGVIADSLDIKTRAFGELFKKYGRAVAQKAMAYHLDNGGVSRYEKFKYYYKNLLNKEINQEIINRLDRDYSRLVVEKVIEAPYIKGAVPFLKRLCRQKKDCFVISGTPQREIRIIVRRKKIGHLFKDIVGSPKNKTENLTALLKEYSLDSKETLFFGDAKSDYEAALKNRADFIAVVNKRSRELAKISDILKIKDFCGILDSLHSPE